MNIARTSLQGLTYYNRSKTYSGYTLFAPVFGLGDVWLIDMDGRFVHQWRMPYPPGLCGILLPNGNLLYNCKIPGGPLDDFGGSAGKIIEVDLDGNIVWEHTDPYLSHAFHRMKNGNTMLLYWVQIPEEIVKKVKGGLAGTEREGIMWGDALKEVTPDGEIVWRWIGYEHMDPEIDILCPLCGRARWANANAVSVYDNGDVLMTFRFTNMMFIVDRKTGHIKWRWGPGELAHPHDPTVLENGNILVYDNGMHRPAPYDDICTHSRVVELNPGTKEIVWQYKDETPFHFYSFAVSGCERLPNGNTLICEGFMGRIFEVTQGGETVWEYVAPFHYHHPTTLGRSNMIFRAYRYGPEYAGLRGTDLTSGKCTVTRVTSETMESRVSSRLGHLGY